MLILSFGSRSGFADDFGQSDTKTIILRHFLAKSILEITLPWATPKVPGSQLFERMCYTLIRKVTKFQLPTRDSF